MLSEHETAIIRVALKALYPDIIPDPVMGILLKLDNLIDPAFLVKHRLRLNPVVEKRKKNEPSRRNPRIVHWNAERKGLDPVTAWTNITLVAGKGNTPPEAIRDYLTNLAKLTKPQARRVK